MAGEMDACALASFAFLCLLWVLCILDAWNSPHHDVDQLGNSTAALLKTTTPPPLLVLLLLLTLLL